MNFDTIFAPITASGGAVNMIRISGKNACNVLNVFNLQKLEHKVAKTVKLYHQSCFLDQVIISFFESPNSFTGDHVIEISMHGGLFILHKIIDILSTIDGFRMAEPGEFSKRAFFNGKIDLITAEGIDNIIKAKTQSQHFLASKMLSGDSSNIYNGFRSEILQIFSLIEANIDFSDEDLPIEIVSKYKQKIADLSGKISEYLSKNKNKELVMQGIKIAIVGVPNVGKSSLINLLLSRDVAIVTDIAGTTRDSLEFSMDIDGMQIKLVDTAGIRNALDTIEKIGIERSVEHAKTSDIKIIVCTGMDNIPDLTIENTDIIVLNKIDTCQNYNDIAQHLSQKYNCKVVAISAKNKLNIDLLFKQISQNAKQITNFDNSGFYLNQRHISLLTQAVISLNKAIESTEIEIIAENLRRSGFLIGQISGVIKTDDVLNEIFSKFCIGK